MIGRLISRYRQHLRVHVDDYRLLFGTPAQKAAVRRQIEKRSQAAKRGWAKRRDAALATEARTAETPQSGSVHEGAGRDSDNAQNQSPSNDIGVDKP